MTDHDHETVDFRTRTVLHLHLTDEDDGPAVIVDHVYEPEGMTTCECGAPGHDPGMVGLMLAGGEKKAVSVLLTPERALLVANRLTRAANFALESGEDPLDLDREAARYAPHEAPGEGEA